MSNDAEGTRSWSLPDVKTGRAGFISSKIKAIYNDATTALENAWLRLGWEPATLLVADDTAEVDRGRGVATDGGQDELVKTELGDLPRDPEWSGRADNEDLTIPPERVDGHPHLQHVEHDHHTGRCMECHHFVTVGPDDIEHGHARAKNLWQHERKRLGGDCPHRPDGVDPQPRGESDTKAVPGGTVTDGGRELETRLVGRDDDSPPVGDVECPRCGRTQRLEAGRYICSNCSAEFVAEPSEGDAHREYADDEVLPDGGTVEPDIQVGDVCLDLAQGRPVHVLEDTGQTAAEWSEANDYDLVGNYGNGRLGASDDDRVFDVVYCSSAKSEPSKTYAFPESRLLRIETEAADDGRPVVERAKRELLVDLFGAALRDNVDTKLSVVLEQLAQDVVDEDLAAEARELAEVDDVIGGGDQ